MEDLYFQLLFDDYGAYLEPVDQKLKPVTVDYRQYSGPVREVLRALESIQEKNSFVIDWEKTPDQVYLAEHDYLIWQLRLCPNVVDSTGAPITFAEGESKVVVRVEGEETLRGEVLLRHKGQEHTNLQIISEGYALSLPENRLLAIKPLGSNFNRLPLFQTQLPALDLEKYLSLLLSSFQNVEVQYQDFQTVPGKEPLAPQPTLVFEKIDENNALFLRITPRRCCPTSTWIFWSSTR